MTYLRYVCLGCRDARKYCWADRPYECCPPDHCLNAAGGLVEWVALNDVLGGL